MTETKRNRIGYIDTAKGIGIILVCLGHAITNANKSVNVEHSVLLQFISQFHMPFFFAISGFVFSESSFVNPLKASWKKFKAYYIPFVVYNLIFVLLHNPMAYLHIFSEQYSLGETGRKIISVLTFHIQEICGAMWFVRTLFTIGIMFIWMKYFIRRLLPEKYEEVITGILVLGMQVFSLLGICPRAFRMDLACSYFLFFYLGWLLKKYEWHKYVTKNRHILAVIGLVLNVIFANAYTYAIGGPCEGYVVVIRYIGQLSGILMLLSISQFNLVSNNRLLRYLGTKTLDIMALHFVCFKIVSYVIIAVYGLEPGHMEDIPVVFGIGGFWWILYVMVGLSVPVVVRMIFEKTRSVGVLSCRKDGTLS